MDLQPVLEQRAKVEEFTRKHRIGLLTLLFTDLAGSTKLKQDLGDVHAVPLLQRHRHMVREILHHFKEAEEIETAGDSFCIVFAKPSEAVKFALLLKRIAACLTGLQV
jgi:class 3 adenylate cyclase